MVFSRILGLLKALTAYLVLLLVTCSNLEDRQLTLPSHQYWLSSISYFEMCSYKYFGPTTSKKAPRIEDRALILVEIWKFKLTRNSGWKISYETPKSIRRMDNAITCIHFQPRARLKKQENRPKIVCTAKYNVIVCCIKWVIYTGFVTYAKKIYCINYEGRWLL